MLTFDIGQKAIEQLRADAEATKGQIGASWYFYDSTRQQDIGAVQTIEDTSIRALQSTLQPTLDGTKREADWLALCKVAEDSLKACAHYAGDATVSAVLQQTAAQTASDVKDAAQAAADTVRQVAGSALSIAWSALPTPAKALFVVGALGIVAVGVVQLRAAFAGVKAAAGAA